MVTRILLLAILCLISVASVSIMHAQSNQCAPNVPDYLNLPKLSYDRDHLPVNIPSWGPNIKRVDRYGREVAPAANAANAIATARQYSQDLGESLRLATARFWNEFDSTGMVSEVAKRNYAYFIVDVWSHNSDMGNLNNLIGNADAGLITGTASVQLPQGWHKIGYHTNVEELLLLASRADYLVYSECAPGRTSGTGGEIVSSIEYLLLKRAKLTDWEYVSNAVEDMQLDSFTLLEQDFILKKMRLDSRELEPKYDISSPAAIRTWLVELEDEPSFSEEVNKIAERNHKHCLRQFSKFSEKCDCEKRVMSELGQVLMPGLLEEQFEREITRITDEASARCW